MKGSCLCLSVDDGVTGADCNAGLAARALGVVDYGQVIDHGNCSVRALLGAHAAGYAAYLAGVHYFLALALRVAGNVYLSGGRDALYDVLGAGVDAGSATYAGVGVDLGKLTRYGDSVFGTYSLAVAAAEAAVLADLIASEQRIVCRAGGVARVYECVDGICRAAVALYYCNRALFFLELHAENGGNFSLLFGGSNVAIGEVCLTAGKLGSKA